jgi:hypothetical protein
MGLLEDKSIVPAGAEFFSSNRDIFLVANMLTYPYAPASRRHLGSFACCVVKGRQAQNSRCGRRGGGWEYKLR